MFFGIILSAFLILLNAFFVAAEFAIVKIRSSQVEIRIREGNKMAKLAKKMITHLDKYLSATQLGVTLASLGLGWVGEDITTQIILKLMGFFGIGITTSFAHQIAAPAAFILLTILQIVFGELAPKSLAISKAEKTTYFIAAPLHIFYIIFQPTIWLLNTSANLLLKIFGIHTVAEEHPMRSTEELKFLLEESSKQGVLATTDHELMENVFEFSHTPIKQVMVPRGNIVGIEISMNSRQFIEKYLEEGYSRMPVYDKNIDNIVGIIYSKNIIDMLTYKNLLTIKDLIRPAYFVGENEKIDRVFRHMQKNKLHIAIVLDEFGGTAGLATIEDIIEEIFGEIQDDDDEEIPIVRKISDKEFIIEANAPIADINELLPIKLQESDDYETLGGMILYETDRIPQKGEHIDFNNFSVEILKATNLKIETVKFFINNKEKENEESN